MMKRLKLIIFLLDTKIFIIIF